PARARRPRDARRPRRPGGADPRRRAAPGRGPARPRPAGAERLRGLPPAARRGVGARDPDHRDHRLGPGRGPAALEGRRLRRPSRQAGRFRGADGAPRRSRRHDGHRALSRTSVRPGGRRTPLYNRPSTPPTRDSPSMAIQEATLLQALQAVVDPETGRDYVSAKQLKNLRIEGGDVVFDVELGYPARSQVDAIRKALIAAARGVAGVANISVNVTSKVVAHAVQRGVQLLPSIKNIVAVASGK